MQGVKGLLQQAGFTVYNPTLPFHYPGQPWNPTDGEVSVQTYVDVYKKACPRAHLKNPRIPAQKQDLPIWPS